MLTLSLSLALSFVSVGRFCWTPTLFADKDVPNVAQLQAAAGGALHCLNLLSLIPLPLDLLCCSPPTFLPSCPLIAQVFGTTTTTTPTQVMSDLVALYTALVCSGPLSLRLACSLFGTPGIVARRFFTSSLATTHPSPCQMTESPPPSTACELSLLGLFPVSAPPHTLASFALQLLPWSSVPDQYDW